MSAHCPENGWSCPGCRACSWPNNAILPEVPPFRSEVPMPNELPAELLDRAKAAGLHHGNQRLAWTQTLTGINVVWRGVEAPEPYCWLADGDDKPFRTEARALDDWLTRNGYPRPTSLGVVSEVMGLSEAVAQLKKWGFHLQVRAPGARFRLVQDWPQGEKVFDEFDAEALYASVRAVLIPHLPPEKATLPNPGSTPACLTPSEGATLAERMYCWYNAGGPADRAGLNFQGNPCPVWTELPEAVRAKWEAVASAAAFDLHGLIRSGVVRGVGEREDPAALHWDMGYRAALRWIGAAFGQHTDFDSWDTSEVEHLRVCVVDEIKRGMGPRNTLTGLAGACADLREFNHRAGVPNRQTPMLPEDPRENAPLWAELRTTVERFEGAESNIKLFHTGEVALMARLMVSEMTETLDALSNNDIVGFADGLADGIYVHVQAAMRCGIPLEKVWAAVQAANLSKFPMCSPCAGTGWVKTEGVSTAGGYTVVGGVEGQCPFCHGIGTIVLRDANGKVMKPPGFTPPDIATILKGGA